MSWGESSRCRMLQHASSPEPDVVITLRRCYVNYTGFLFGGEWSSNSPVWCARHRAVKCVSIYLADDIHLVSDRRSLRSSSDNMCAVPRTHNSFGDRSFSAVGPRIWNSLPRGLYGHWTATNILRHCWRHMCFNKATALCDILYKRLRNILTYLLTYINRHTSLHFTISAISATEHNWVIWLSEQMRWARRSWTVLAMALQQEKLHGRTDRRQRSLQLREDALRLGHRYDQRSDDQHSAVGRRLETWHCYNCWVLP